MSRTDRQDMAMLSRRKALAAMAGALWASWPRGAAGQGKLRAVASFTILADLVSNVGGERVSVTSLIGPNGNPHAFEPSPADAKRLAAADIIFLNGLGFDPWTERLASAAGARASLVTASRSITPRTNASGSLDPHAWQSVENAERYVETIRDALIAADPAGRAGYRANASAYLDQLAALDRGVKDATAAIPPERRRVLTSHDAFGYFQDAYGIEFSSLQSVSREADISAKDVAALITLIRHQKIAAAFLENVTDPRLMGQIARETGVAIGGTLYSDALTEPGGEAPTYVDLIRHNLRELVAALRR